MTVGLIKFVAGGKVICESCEMLNETKVYKDWYGFLVEKDGWKCLFNGAESTEKSELCKQNCRLKRG